MKFQIKNLRIFFSFFFVIFFTFYFLTLGLSSGRRLLPFAHGQREMDDYFYQYEKYRSFHQNYLLARDKYWKYQTLTAQQELIKAIQEFLHSRSLVLRTYLQALKYQLGQAKNISLDERRNLVLALDREVTWLLDGEEEIRNLSEPTFDDLLAITARVEKKEELFKKLAYQTLGTILLGKMRALQSELLAINFLLADKISKSGQEKDAVSLNQWLEQVNDFTLQAQKGIERAEDYLEDIEKKGGKDVLGNYANLQSELEQSRLLLTQATNYQKEILREVGSE